MRGFRTTCLCAVGALVLTAALTRPVVAGDMSAGVATPDGLIHTPPSADRPSADGTIHTGAVQAQGAGGEDLTADGEIHARAMPDIKFEPQH